MSWDSLDFGDESRPVDQLLLWHFRQAVFANMREAGEPVFESDFPPGLDMVDEIIIFNGAHDSGT